MDVSTVNLDWNLTRAFLITAREGSFSAAAEVMGLTQPTLSRQIAALEASLNVVLFEKSGRGLVMTPTGKDLLEHAMRMDEAAQDFTLAATGSSSSLKGDVCVSAIELTAGFVLPKLALKFKNVFPDIRIEILATNETSDLRKREADIAIRAFQPTQLDLIGKKLGVQKWGLFASTFFVSTHAQINSKQGLESVEFIGYDSSDSLVEHLKAKDIHIQPDNIVVVTNNMLVGLELIKNGAGIGVLPIEIGEAQVELQQVASSLLEFEVDCWLVTHSELRTNRRIRAVFDFLDTELCSLLNADQS